MGVFKNAMKALKVLTGEAREQFIIQHNQKRWKRRSAVLEAGSRAANVRHAKNKAVRRQKAAARRRGSL